ncbi:MAG: carboxypeptidase M32 [Spirochaetales bacterium]|jgi:carboxypeptidase Taq|nr:carboxypeptidase M32 [Spirochaetales bacterium]
MNEKAWEKLRERGREILLLVHIQSLLSWDEEVNLPARGAGERADQNALLEGRKHDLISDPALGELLQTLGAAEDLPVLREAGAEPEVDYRNAYLRFFYRHWKKTTALPRDLAVDLARTASLAHQEWIQARRRKDFSLFVEPLTGVLALTRRKAEIFAPGQELYDGLLDEYEPGMNRAVLDRLFSPLKKELTGLLQQIAARPRPEEGFFYQGDYSPAKQEALSRRFLEKAGFPADRTLLSRAVHPATFSLGDDDVRITTRYNEPHPFNSFFSTVHEAGHAFYSLGGLDEVRGNLLSGGSSLGLHESQSRTLENLIGRSRSFWRWFYPEAQDVFEALKGVAPEDFYRAINKVEPGFIRTDADEVSYSLHVILRYELESALLSGELKPKDLEGEWNQKMKDYLGLTVPDPALGVLQDVHWSLGYIGYFPTYVLGNFYGAGFIKAAEKAMPDLWRRIEGEGVGFFTRWSRENIHAYGSALSSAEVIQKVTGAGLSPDYFIEYLKAKYGEIYRL